MKIKNKHCDLIRKDFGTKANSTAIGTLAPVPVLVAEIQVNMQNLEEQLPQASYLYANYI